VCYANKQVAQRVHQQQASSHEEDRMIDEIIKLFDPYPD